MARKTTGSAVRSKKTATPTAESVSVPAVATVSADLSANAPETAKATPVTATPVTAIPVSATKTVANGNKQNAIPQSVVPPSAAKQNGNGSNGAKLNLDEEIRRRAYELFLQRNGTAGDPNRDWLVAENEVKARHAVAGR